MKIGSVCLTKIKLVDELVEKICYFMANQKEKNPHTKRSTAIENLHILRNQSLLCRKKARVTPKHFFVNALSAIFRNEDFIGVRDWFYYLIYPVEI